MKITLWGTRGSLACSSPETKEYGGNTSCVEVRGINNTLLILDAGTGIRKLGTTIDNTIKRIDILLTHLHLDHIQGLGFFIPLFNPNMEIHIYGPASSDKNLRILLTKYLSPPLFPVILRELPCRFYIHAISNDSFEIGEFSVISQAIIHPGFTLGYRITSKAGSIAYLPDHEPALGTRIFPIQPNWTSGYDLIANVDLLIHDSQYTDEEYRIRVGWGHSTIEQALKLAKLANVKNFITFHHDPSHEDIALDTMLKMAAADIQSNIKIYPGKEGLTTDLEKINQRLMETTI